MQLLILLFLTSTSFSRTIPGCIDPSYFEINKAAFFNEKALSYAELNKVNPLQGAFETGFRLGAGSFGLVHKISFKGKDISAKEIGASIYDSEAPLIREISFLKKMCGVNPKLESKETFECSTTATVQFYGCVQIGDRLYLLQELLYRDLEKPDSVATYQSKEAINRAKAMKTIVDKFEILHSKKIIHNDIKPENIMCTSKQMTDFRIIDLGLGLDLNDPTDKGSPYFKAWEKIGQKGEATPAMDIYALALSFAIMEESLGKVLYGNPDSCYLNDMTPECNQHILQNIETVFSKKGLVDLTPVIQKAAALKPDQRYSSMKEFSDKIEEVIIKLESSKNAAFRPELTLETASQPTKTGNEIVTNFDLGTKNPADKDSLTKTKDTYDQYKPAPKQENTFGTPATTQPFSMGNFLGADYGVKQGTTHDTTDKHTPAFKFGAFYKEQYDIAAANTLELVQGTPIGTNYDTKYDATKFDNKYDLTKYDPKYDNKYDLTKYDPKYDDKYDLTKYDAKYENKYDLTKYDAKYGITQGTTQGDILSINHEAKFEANTGTNYDNKFGTNNAPAKADILTIDLASKYGLNKDPSQKPTQDNLLTIDLASKYGLNKDTNQKPTQDNLLTIDYASKYGADLKSYLDPQPATYQQPAYPNPPSYQKAMTLAADLPPKRRFEPLLMDGAPLLTRGNTAKTYDTYNTVGQTYVSPIPEYKPLKGYI